MDPRQLNRVGRDLSGLDDPVGLHPSGSARHRTQRFEIAGGGMEHEVAVPVCYRSPYQGEVSGNGFFQQLPPASELPRNFGW